MLLVIEYLKYRYPIKANYDILNNNKGLFLYQFVTGYWIDINKDEECQLTSIKIKWMSLHF